MLVLGKEKVDYVSKKTGNQVKGYTLHLGTEKKGCDGLAVNSVFVSELLGSVVNLSDDIEILYNAYGSPLEIRKITK